jgi:hypothetical protein
VSLVVECVRVNPEDGRIDPEVASDLPELDRFGVEVVPEVAGLNRFDKGGAR